MLRKVVHAACLTVFYVIVMSAGLELATRLLRPQSLFSATVNTWDPFLGTRQVAGATGFVTCPEFDTRIEINSKGLRDREYPYAKPAGVKRILSLGDSFACGYGVAADDTYAKVLERGLGARGIDWEVLNAGVGSTGTAQQLAYFIDEGCRYSPDVVLLGFFVANDPWDNATCGLYSIENGELVRRVAPRTGARRIQAFTKWIPGYRFLLHRSHLLSLVRYEIGRWHASQLQARAVSSEAGRKSRDPMQLTRRLLTALRDTCAEHGASLVVMLIPAPAGSSPANDEREGDIDRFLAAENVPCLDLGPAFRRERAERTIEYARDKHWTAEGHTLAAETLLAFLEDRGLIPQPAARDSLRP